MLDTITLAVSGEHMTPLDEDAMAAIVGGGPLEWIAKKVVEAVMDCLISGADALIDAAKAGYEDAR
ncbi:MAG: hypothetical protein ACT4PJ_17410 [Gemmatimonadaceae bacterium]